MSRLVVLGDSHALALAEGFAQLKARGEEAFPGEVRFLPIFDGPDNLAPFFRRDGDGIAFLGDRPAQGIIEALGAAMLSPEDRDTIYAFSMGLMITLLLRQGDWKRSTPSSLAPATHGKRHRNLVSELLVEAMALENQKHVIDFARAVRQVGLRAFIIAAPPMREDDRAIERGRPAAVLLEVNRICRRALVRSYSEAGLRVLEPPPETYQDGDVLGFMRSDLRRLVGRDSHHGNAAYGEIMMRHVLALASSMS